MRRGKRGFAGTGRALRAAGWGLGREGPDRMPGQRDQAQPLGRTLSRPGSVPGAWEPRRPRLHARLPAPPAFQRRCPFGLGTEIHLLSRNARRLLVVTTALHALGSCARVPSDQGHLDITVPRGHVLPRTWEEDGAAGASQVSPTWRVPRAWAGSTVRGQSGALVSLSVSKVAHRILA